MASPHINMDSKLGAAFLGNLAAGIFYGITCVQAYIYSRKDYKDSWPFRTLIFFLWILDSVHLALITHALYYYMVSNYGNLAAIASPTWSVIVQVHLTIVSDGIIRAIFARRVWLITRHNKLLLAAIFAFSALTFITGFIFATRVFALKTFANFSKISYLLYMALGGGVVADTTIAGALCVSLWRSRTGFSQTDSIVGVLIMYTINTSLLTTICSAACFITYAIWPGEFTFIGIYFSLSKLFFNSLLATLNGRDSLKQKLKGISEVALSEISTRRVEYSSKYTHEDTSQASSPVIVTIDREVEEDDGSRRQPYHYPKSPGLPSYVVEEK